MRLAREQSRWISAPPTANPPSNVIQPPSNNVAVNPQRIAIRINGVNAAESRIARRRWRNSSLNEQVVCVPIRGIDAVYLRLLEIISHATFF